MNEEEKIELLNVKVLLKEWRVGLLSNADAKIAERIFKKYSSDNFAITDKEYQSFKKIEKVKKGDDYYEKIINEDNRILENLKNINKFYDKKSYNINAAKKIKLYIGKSSLIKHLKQIKKMENSNNYIKILSKKSEKMFETKKKLSKNSTKKRKKKIKDIIRYEFKKQKQSIINSIVRRDDYHQNV